MRKLSHQEIVARQKERMKIPRVPLCVVLNNIRSAHNVGSIFRTCDGAGIEKVWLCGITGYPPNAQITKTALGAEQHVDWEYREDIYSLVKELKDRGYQIVLLEQTEKSVLYQDFKPKGPVCLVVGNEVSGVCETLTSLCDQAIEIEMDGVKNSLNVSVAFGIVAYYLRNLIIKRK
ncbi:MAG: RNA methyltransferase [Candidatus Omnitrophica bacterium]|nr:RNA methyltransferase [Candidatus Omnitrophota bacterium]